MLTRSSQKYYKLRKEADGQTGSPPSTPKKRKASGDDDEEERKKTSPSKRAREAKREVIDGVLFSDASGSPQDFKAEDTVASVLDSFQSQNMQYTAAAFFPAVNMDDQLYGQISAPFNGHSSGNNSCMG